MMDLLAEYVLFSMMGLTTCWGPYCPPDQQSLPERTNRTVLTQSVRNSIRLGYRSNPGAGIPQALPSRIGQWSVLRVAVRGGFLPGGGGGGDLGRSDYEECMMLYPAEFCDPFVR